MVVAAVVCVQSAMLLCATWKARALITWTYFFGSLEYTAGAYLGWFEVILPLLTSHSLLPTARSSLLTQTMFWPSTHTIPHF